MKPWKVRVLAIGPMAFLFGPFEWHEFYRWHWLARLNAWLINTSPMCMASAVVEPNT